MPSLPISPVVATRRRHGAVALANFDALPDSAQVPSAVAEAILGVTRPTLYAWRKSGRIEEPAVLGPRTVRYSAGSIRRALDLNKGGAR